MKEILVPRINSNDNQVQIAKWYFKPGAYIEKGYTLVDLETSKTTISIDAEISGYLSYENKERAIINVGDVLYYLGSTPNEAIPSKILHQESLDESDEKKINSSQGSTQILTENKESVEVNFEALRFSRNASILMKQLNLNENEFHNAGLVTVQKIRAKNQPTTLIDHIDENPLQKKELINRKNRRRGPIVPREEYIPVSKNQEISQLQIGASGQINSTLSISFSSSELRDFLNTNRLFGNIRAVILFEICRLLPEWPQFTAYFEGGQIHYYDRIDLGLALDLGDGLKVARIKDADLLDLKQLEEGIIDLTLRYARNELTEDDLVGSTITVTDLSSMDILNFYPLINGFQSLIIGIGADSSIPSHPMSIIITFDHRITTGRDVGTFLKKIRQNILGISKHLNTSSL